MTKFSKILILLFISVAIIGQNKKSVTYIESEKVISNPERGFSVYRESPISVSLINDLKIKKITVIQRIYIIPQFNNSSLSQDFLNIVQSDLNTAREGGVKVVLRFSYTNDQNGVDAPMNIILQHIEQLKPLFQNNYDVILYIEAGFIGAWGEWYYSSNNLNNTADRKTLLFALLDAVPPERCVVIRTPEYKRNIFDDTRPISISEAFNGSKKSRTGAHNDCFLASETDQGTYVEGKIEEDKNYLNQDNMFVPQGGETCSPSQYSGCENASNDLRRMHWSVLNKDYHPTVIDGWETDGCYADIQKYLGYRFVLLNSEITNSVKPGGEFSISFKLKNKGFASPFNPRNLEFVLRNSYTKSKYKLVTDEDPRFWFSDSIVTVNIKAGILNTMPEGEYELFMHLADPEETLHDKPEYSIQLGNEDLWEDSTGYNSLKVNVLINSAITGNNYLGEKYFNLVTDTTSSEMGIKIDGTFEDWNNILAVDVSPYEELVGDNPNPSADIVDVWITDNEENLYISYSLDSNYNSSLFYHIFFDIDNDTSTGFHSAGSYAGIDIMIENDQMWKYTGTNGEWSWESYGYFSSAVGTENKKRMEFAIPKSLLIASKIKNSIQILINVNDDNESVDDDFFPNSYKEKNFSYKYLITSIEKTDEKVIPAKINIDAYPNPFNGLVNITFDAKVNEIKSAEIYDVLGRIVYSFDVKELKKNNIIWKAKNNFGSDVVSGVYLFVIKTKYSLNSGKIILMK